MKELRNNFDKEICFTEGELDKAKYYFTDSEESEYAEAIAEAETLEELADVLNHYSDEYGNGSRYYVREF